MTTKTGPKKSGPKVENTTGRLLDGRITIRLPVHIRNRIDDAREEYGQNRSEFVRGIVINYFRQMMLPVIRDTRLGPRLED